MTDPGVGFGIRSMPLLLHTGQCVGRRGGSEASPMGRSVGKGEAVRKFQRTKKVHQGDPQTFRIAASSAATVAGLLKHGIPVCRSITSMRSPAVRQMTGISASRGSCN